jgi:hypothetical protein
LQYHPHRAGRRLRFPWLAYCFACFSDPTGREVNVAVHRDAHRTLRPARKQEDFVKASVRLFLVLVALFIVVSAVPAFAGPVPSKTAADQSISARDNDLALVKNFTAREDVAQALAAQGFSRTQVESKVAGMSDQDLHNLAQNLNEIQAAGMTREQWIWIGIGALAALILVVAL